jgi:hypothetical protein
MAYGSGYTAQGFVFVSFPLHRFPCALLFLVGFVPLTVAGQRWICTTFPSRFALFHRIGPTSICKMVFKINDRRSKIVIYIFWLIAES